MAAAAPAPPGAGTPPPTATPAPASSAPGSAGGSGSGVTPAAPRQGEPVTLNFINAEIDAVARAMSALTGRNLVIDPRVKGTLNLSTERAVTPAAAYNQFLAALRLQGFTVVEVAGLDKVVPEADAKLQAGPVAAGAVRAGGSQIVTQIYRLNFESAGNLVPVLRPLISPNNTLNVNAGNNSLVITDYADNLQRIGKIIAALDVANASDVEILPLKHAIAVDLAPLVQRLLDASPSGAPAATGQGSGYKTTLLAEPRSNALVLRAANAAQLALIKALVLKLDQPDAAGSNAGNSAAGNIHVVYLKNADASKLAVTLRAALSAEVRSSAGSTPTSTGTSSSAAATAAGASQPTTGGQIQADTATNALIITAPEPQYRQLRAVIDQLDARRAQVFVESLIAEVSADQAAEFGIQWQGALGQKGDSTVGFVGSNFGNGGSNIISLATQGASGTVVPAKGINLTAFQKTNGVYVLGFLARFLEETGTGNVLSTPNLLTLDNEEAKIVIGQNVPFVTGQFTNTGASSGSSTVNPFQTIERKDVGLTLKVKPQISENGSVKLAIYQEVSSVQASTVNAANGPTTNKRTIESNVMVQDGAIVVLGGLLQDEYSGGQEKIPGLGDVPFFGSLFRSETRSRKKTNLMVFLRPVVVRDAAAVEQLSLDRYDLMRAGQQRVQPTPSGALPISAAPLLPETRPGGAAVAPVKP